MRSQDSFRDLRAPSGDEEVIPGAGGERLLQRLKHACDWEVLLCGCSYETILCRCPCLNTHTATILHLHSDVRLWEKPEKSTSWSSLPRVSARPKAGISAFTTPATLLLLQLAPLPGPRQSILALIYRCWQQPAFSLTPACNTNTPSTGYCNSAQTSGPRAQQTERSPSPGALGSASGWLKAMTQTQHLLHKSNYKDENEINIIWINEGPLTVAQTEAKQTGNTGKQRLSRMAAAGQEAK